MKTEHQLPKGTYYVGDLCYILNEVWDEVLGHTFHSDEDVPGRLKDGRKFIMYGTRHGDGAYYDEEKREYAVDSGCIGCVQVKARQKPVDGGHIIKFDQPFSTSKDGAVIKIGNLSIDTDPEDEEEECCQFCGRW